MLHQDLATPLTNADHGEAYYLYIARFRLTIDRATKTHEARSLLYCVARLIPEKRNPTACYANIYYREYAMGAMENDVSN